ILVKPDYVYTAYIAIVPPAHVEVSAGDPAPVERNPWMTQDLTTIGNAALITVQDSAYARSLKAAGLSEKYQAVIDNSNPLVTLTITGSTRKQATDTADRLVGEFDESLNALQSTYGVVAADLITARRLDGGDNLSVSNSDVKRTLILVAGLGILVTAGMTLG